MGKALKIKPRKRKNRSNQLKIQKMIEKNCELLKKLKAKLK